MCQKVVQNDLKRNNAYNILRGGHLNEVVFQCQCSNFTIKKKYREKNI